MDSAVYVLDVPAPWLPTATLRDESWCTRFLVTTTPPISQLQGTYSYDPTAAENQITYNGKNILPHACLIFSAMFIPVAIPVPVNSSLGYLAWQHLLFASTHL